MHCILASPARLCCAGNQNCQQQGVALAPKEKLLLDSVNSTQVHTMIQLQRYKKRLGIQVCSPPCSLREQLGAGRAEA